jgi:hypothetical protein
VVVILQDDDSGFGLSGVSAGLGEFVNASSEWAAASVDKRFFTATREYIVTAISATVTVAGTDAGAVTLTVRKVPSGTVITSGTALHTGTVNLKGTADTKQDLTLSATPSDLLLAAGDSLACDFAGTLTAATGVLTVGLRVR